MAARFRFSAGWLALVLACSSPRASLNEPDAATADTAGSLPGGAAGGGGGARHAGNGGSGGGGGVAQSQDGSTSAGSGGGSGDSGAPSQPGSGGAPPPTRFTARIEVKGEGRVRSPGGEIDCPGICTAEVAAGATLDLEAQAIAGQVFEGWSGDCSGKGSCRLVVDQARTVMASFRSTQVFQVPLPAVNSAHLALRLDDVYVAGIGFSALDFGDGPRPIVGKADAFVARFNASKGTLSWAETYATKEDDVFSDVALSAAGDPYITGWTNAALTIGGSTIVGGQTGTQAFAVRFSPSGLPLWAVPVTGSAYRLLIESSGNVLIASGIPKVLLRLDPQGGKLPPSGDLTPSSLAFAQDPGDNVFVCVHLFGEYRIGTRTITSTGEADILLIKYDSNGNVQWTNQLGGPQYQNCFTMELDRAGDVYIGGSFDGTMRLGSESWTARNGDGLVAKFAGSDGRKLWVQPIAGEGGDIVDDLEIDAKGNVVLGGRIGGPVTVDGHDLDRPHLIRLSPAGKFLAAHSFENQGRVDAFALHDSGDFIVVGSALERFSFPPP